MQGEFDAAEWVYGCGLAGVTDRVAVLVETSACSEVAMGLSLLTVSYNLDFSAFRVFVVAFSGFNLN